MKATAVIHLLSDARGIYIPRDFAELFGEYISEEDSKILANPDNEWYWDTWCQVLNNTTIEIKGAKYSLHQDGDLWAIRPEDMSMEEQWNFFREVPFKPKGVEELTIPSWLMVPLMYGDLSGLNSEEEKIYRDFVVAYGDEIVDHYDVGFRTYFDTNSLAGEGTLVWIKER
jgi:hypothetical protein